MGPEPMGSDKPMGRNHGTGAYGTRAHGLGPMGSAPKGVSAKYIIWVSVSTMYNTMQEPHQMQDMCDRGTAAAVRTQINRHGQ